MLVVVAVLAVVSLVLTYGGFDPQALPLSVDALHVVQTVLVGWFVLDRLLRVGLAWNRRRFLRDNWVDYVLLGALAVSLVLVYEFPRNVVGVGALYVVVTQAYLLASLLVRAVNAHIRIAGSGLPSSWLLIGTFGTLCLVGSGLLMLPVSVRAAYSDDWRYIDALFTAVSASCVTGLVVTNTGETFTLFGQTVILGLIQLGGLGIMIFGTVLAMLTGKALSLRGTEAMGEMLASDRPGDIKRIALFVVAVTVILEVLGTMLLFPMFRDLRTAAGTVILSSPMAMFHAVFHSVSAFCNAGFALYGENMMQGAAQGWAKPLRDYPQILGVMAPLILLGGLGFPVLDGLVRHGGSLAKRMHRRWRPTLGGGLPRPYLSLHARIVLITSLALILVGALGLFILEQSAVGLDARPSRFSGERNLSNDWQRMALMQKAEACLFQSISARTAGFNTIDMDQLTESGKLWMCGLMTIGGSPASTAGGIKTTTFALLLIATWSVLWRRDDTEAFDRRIPANLVRKAITLMVLYGGLVLGVTFLLNMRMGEERLIDLLFEACSACGTVGLSTGVTNRLDEFGKSLIVLAMFAGRVGPLTLFLAVTARKRTIEYSYPSENVNIG